MGVKELFEQMLARFDAAAGGSLDAVFQYRIDDSEEYHLIVQEGACTLSAGVHDAPSVTLSMSQATFGDILSGETDGMQAFMAGQVQAKGDLMLATCLPQLFPAA